MSVRPRCEHWIGAERRLCGAEVGVRRYLTGRRCPLHTPQAVADWAAARAGDAG